MARDTARDTAYLLILGISCFASALGARTMDPMVPTIAAEMATPIATVALLSTSYAIPYGLCQPVLGPLGDMLGKALVLKICVVLMALAIGAGALASSLDLLFVSRVAAGAAAGGVIPLALAMVGDRFEIAHRQVAIGRLMAVTLIGQIVGVTASGLLVQAVGWRGAIWASAAVGGVAALVLMLGTRGHVPEKSHGFSVASSFGRYAEIFRNRRAFICYGGVFAEGLAIYGVLPYVAEIVQARGAGGPAEAGFIISGIGIGGFLFSIFVARVLALLGPFGTMRGGGIVCGLGLAGFGVVHDWPMGLVCFSLIGFGFFMLHSSLQNRATELAPSARGSAVALHAFFFFSGQGLAPMLFGPAYHVAGAAPSLLVCGLAMAATGLVAAQLMIRADRADAKPV